MKRIILIFVMIFVFASCGKVYATTNISKNEMAASILSSVKFNQEDQSVNVAAVSNALSSENVFDKIKQSTVRIGMRYSGTASHPTPVYDKKTDTYVPGKTMEEYDLDSYFLGSGFFISKDGYIITNAHVVDSSISAVDDGLWSQYQDNVYNNLLDMFPEESDEIINEIYDKLIDYSLSNLNFSNETYLPVVFNPNNSEKTFEEQFNAGYKVDIRKFGNPYPEIGKDLAIIKIEKNDATPVIIGNSDDVKAGQKVYVIGYPTIADLSDKAFNVPSFTAGIISAVKPSDLGDYNVIQIDASIKGGNSGGPAVNEKAEVIGVATFGTTGSDSYNWILPINIAKDFIRELNIQVTSPMIPSTFGSIKNFIIPAIVVLVMIAITVAILFILKFRKNKKQLSPQPYVAQVPPLQSPNIASPAMFETELNEGDDEQDKNSGFV